MTQISALQPAPTWQALREFLTGAAPLEGVWFGEPHPTRKGMFWWRHLLPGAIPAPEGAPEPDWYAVTSLRAPCIDKAIRRHDVAEEYADKQRDLWPDVKVVPLYRAATAPVALADEDRTRALNLAYQFRSHPASRGIDDIERAGEMILSLLAETAKPSPAEAHVDADALRLADAIDPFTRKGAPDHLTSKVAADTLRRLAAANPQPKGTADYSPRDDYEDGDSFAGMGDALQAPAPAPETTRSQRMREAGYTRRPSWKSLPSDADDVQQDGWNEPYNCLAAGPTATDVALHQAMNEAAKVGNRDDDKLIRKALNAAGYYLVRSMKKPGTCEHLLAVPDVQAPAVAHAMTREAAIALATECAAKAQKTHRYLAGALTDPSWAPHSWVVDAILQAAQARRSSLDIDELKDRLVAASAAVADQDDRSAQAILGETLRLLTKEAP